VFVGPGFYGEARQGEGPVRDVEGCARGGGSEGHRIRAVRQRRPGERARHQGRRRPRADARERRG
jgi:hypothetical protein